MNNNHIEVELHIPPLDGFRFKSTSDNNLVIGKNGTGKTLLLDSIFYAVTGEWMGGYIYPVNNNPFFLSRLSPGNPFQRHQYNYKTALWKTNKHLSEMSAKPVLYCKDNKFAVKARNKSVIVIDNDDLYDDLWWGKTGTIEGLLTDWMNWQVGEGVLFNIFSKILNLLSLNPGDLTRVVNNARVFPTLRYSYGDVLLINLSSGIKRVVELLYAIAWFRFKHCAKTALVMIDDLENGLDPAYQEMLVRALPRLQEFLECDLQIIATMRSSGMPSKDFALFHL